MIWGFTSLTALVVGITYALGAVFNGIAFVVTAPAKPFFWIFRRNPANASSTEVSSYDSTADSTEVLTEVVTEIPAAEQPPELREDEIDDAIEVPTSPSIELISQTSELTDKISSSAATRSIVARIAGAVGSIRSSFLDAIQSSVSTVRQAFLQLHRFTVTLSMEEGVIRIVVFRGSQVVKWDHVTLSPEIGISSEEPDPPSDSARFRQVLTELNIRRARVVADLPLFTSLERQFRLPRASRSYVQPMVVAEVLDTIPFSGDEVEIAWHSQHVQGGYDVVAVAAPKSTIDSQVRFARDAGLTPRGTYSKASALALASGLPNAILIHNQPAETGIVLVGTALR